jgi:hypothetical protein
MTAIIVPAADFQLFFQRFYRNPRGVTWFPGRRDMLARNYPGDRAGVRAGERRRGRRAGRGRRARRSEHDHLPHRLAFAQQVEAVIDFGE